MHSQSVSQQGNMMGLVLHTFMHPSNLRCRYRGVTFARLWSRYRGIDFTFAPPSSLRYRCRITDFTFVYKLRKNAFSITYQQGNMKGLVLHTFVPSSSLRCGYREVTFARLWPRYRRTDFTFAPPSSLRCRYRTDFTFEPPSSPRCRYKRTDFTFI